MTQWWTETGDARPLWHVSSACDDTGKPLVFQVDYEAYHAACASVDGAGGSPPRDLLIDAMDTAGADAVTRGAMLSHDQLMLDASRIDDFFTDSDAYKVLKRLNLVMGMFRKYVDQKGMSYLLTYLHTSSFDTVHWPIVFALVKAYDFVSADDTRNENQRSEDAVFITEVIARFPIEWALPNMASTIDSLLVSGRSESECSIVRKLLDSLAQSNPAAGVIDSVFVTDILMVLIKRCVQGYYYCRQAADDTLECPIGPYSAYLRAMDLRTCDLGSCARSLVEWQEDGCLTVPKRFFVSPAQSHRVLDIRLICFALGISLAQLQGVVGCVQYQDSLAPYAYLHGGVIAAGDYIAFDTPPLFLIKEIFDYSDASKRDEVHRDLVMAAINSLEQNPDMVDLFLQPCFDSPSMRDMILSINGMLTIGRHRTALLFHGRERKCPLPITYIGPPWGVDLMFTVTSEDLMNPAQELFIRHILRFSTFGMVMPECSDLAYTTLARGLFTSNRLTPGAVKYLFMMFSEAQFCRGGVFEECIFPEATPLIIDALDRAARADITTRVINYLIDRDLPWEHVMPLWGMC